MLELDFTCRSLYVIMYGKRHKIEAPMHTNGGNHLWNSLFLSPRKNRMIKKIYEPLFVDFKKVEII